VFNLVRRIDLQTALGLRSTGLALKSTHSLTTSTFQDRFKAPRSISVFDKLIASNRVHFNS